MSSKISERVPTPSSALGPPTTGASRSHFPPPSSSSLLPLPPLSTRFSFGVPRNPSLPLRVTCPSSSLSYLFLVPLLPPPPPPRPPSRLTPLHCPGLNPTFLRLSGHRTPNIRLVYRDTVLSSAGVPWGVDPTPSFVPRPCLYPTSLSSGSAPIRPLKVGPCTLGFRRETRQVTPGVCKARERLRV